MTQCIIEFIVRLNCELKRYANVVCGNFTDSVLSTTQQMAKHLTDNGHSPPVLSLQNGQQLPLALNSH